MSTDGKGSKHDFLSEELLVPGVNMCDTMRVNMFDNHILQSVVLANTEFPRVFTNFENQIGELSSALKVAEDSMLVLGRVEVNKNKVAYILANHAKQRIELFLRKECFWLTEHYGWKNVNYIDDFVVGSAIPKGQPLSTNTSYDAEQNFGYGCNLNAVFLPYKNLTFEDAIVISSDAAQKMASYSVQQVDVSINTNDILLNLYGTSKYYKSFPEIGEEITDKTLCARRRISYNSALAELKNSLLGKINPNTDTVFYANGEIVDIEIFCNQPLEELEKHKFFRQEVKILTKQYEYAAQLIELVDKIQKSKKYKNYSISDDLNFEYNRCRLTLDPEKKWTNENKEFNYIVYRFTILEKTPLAVGSKITNR